MAKHPSAQAIGKFLGRHLDFIMGIFGLIILAIPVGAIYVAVHFIRKYW